MIFPPTRNEASLPVADHGFLAASFRNAPQIVDVRPLRLLWAPKVNAGFNALIE